jgi:hypothetical protein
MAPGQNLADRSNRSKDSRRDEYDNNEPNLSSISEITSQDYDNSSVVSGQYDQDSSTEDLPRGELDHKVTVERAPRNEGIKFDRLHPKTPLNRAVVPGQGLRGEVRRQGIEPIQPVQSSQKPANTALSLRLDLNLDVEVDLKASIRGDLTLSLL